MPLPAPPAELAPLDFPAPTPPVLYDEQTPTEGDDCPACGDRRMHTLFRSSDRLYGTTSKEFLVVECVQCRLIRLYPQPPPSELSQYYPPNYWFRPEEGAAAYLEETYRRLVLHDHVQFVRRAIEEAALPESGHPLVLDVGCGGGLFLRMLREQGHRVLGLDFSLDAAGVAWKRNSVPAICGSLTQAPLPRESCSVITMFHVMEHLYDPAGYLDAAHRLLKPDGRLVVQVPNADCWQFLLFGKHWNGVDVPRHFFNFRRRDMDLLLENCGFEVLRHKHFSLRDNPAGLATTVAPSLDPMARRIRQRNETPRMRLLKDLLYLGLVMAAVPFTLLEAACGAGSTIMVEARKKS